MTVRCCSLAIDGDELMIAERDGAVVAVEFGADRAALRRTVGGDELVWGKGLTSPARRQLAEYFAGHRRVFDLPLAPRGTPFQRAVWQALGTIPFGGTCSYADVAERIGRPGAARAVGAANGRNPIAIIVPCHRVIGRDGSLTGYAAGLARKRRLLDHEGVLPPLRRRRVGTRPS
jgi:methylated-DNA-[protein]-cysteine S-methyltransferase